MVLATASFVLAAAQPTLAFIARLYKPGKEKSRFELYVSNLDGSDRKLLRTPETPNFVQWVGTDRLAWFTDSGLYTSKLSPWKPTLVRKAINLGFVESRWKMAEPGVPEIVEDYDRSKGVMTIDPTTVALMPFQEPPSKDDIVLSEAIATDLPNPSSPEHRLKLTCLAPFEYWSNGKAANCDWMALRARTTDSGSKLWVFIGDHDSTTGDVNGVMLFERGKEPKTIFDTANGFDFWPMRPAYAYCTTRELSPLGSVKVWTSELHIGDWTKGSDKAILKGPVWVTSASIRPQ
ncbi:MAG: hypothetical protein GC165_19575 [Armatimonadetes bacterium]|nr:hypothetical protein [Armatimonadota bacterium]